MKNDSNPQLSTATTPKKQLSILISSLLYYFFICQYPNDYKNVGKICFSWEIAPNDNNYNEGRMMNEGNKNNENDAPL